METSRGTYSESVIRRLLVLLLFSYVSKIIEFRIISRFSILCLCFFFYFSLFFTLSLLACQCGFDGGRQLTLLLMVLMSAGLFSVGVAVS